MKCKTSPDDSRATLVYFTPRGHRLLGAILDLVETIESDFANSLPPGEFDRVRHGLRQIADKVDPLGVLGAGDLLGTASVSNRS